ncbi:MAG: DUF4252 domain-containing protein [Alistipes sp.]|nr:DUF4252 domain-containing protein [Alistipes sp.]
MRRYILLLIALLPFVVSAQIPAIVSLGKEASKQKGVEYDSVGSVMLGMAQTFSNKEQRETFKMLSNIEMIECKNIDYAPILTSRVMAIVRNVGATFIASQDDGKALNELYGVKRGDIITELIILVKSHKGGVAVVAMSGEIPTNRLAEIAKIKR